MYLNMHIQNDTHEAKQIKFVAHPLQYATVPLLNFQAKVVECNYNVLEYYRNFRPITRTADYPHGRLPAAVYFCRKGKKVQQITRTGLLPAPQNKRKSCYCITGIRTHKLGAMNIPCCCLQSERSITFSAKNWLLTMQP